MPPTQQLTREQFDEDLELLNGDIDNARYRLEEADQLLDQHARGLFDRAELIRELRRRELIPCEDDDLGMIDLRRSGLAYLLLRRERLEAALERIGGGNV